MIHKTNGTILNSFYICKRKTWLISHEVSPDKDNTSLEIGRIIEQNFYKRDEKGYNFDNIKIDLIRKNEHNIVIGEIKKSSRNIKPAIMQVVYYLSVLKENGIFVKGEIFVPKERKKIYVELTDELEKELSRAVCEIQEIIAKDKPPPKEKIRFCTHCAYREFCWS